MVKEYARSFLPVILLATFPVATWGQDAKAVLGAAVKAMGAESLRTLQLSGSGSSYEMGRHMPMKSYSRHIDLAATSLRVQLVRMQGEPPSEQTVNQVVAADSPWAAQSDFWITPYAFLKGAIANGATVEEKPLYGIPYKVVTFTLPGNRKLVGYINAENMVERVHAWIDSDVLVEGVYRDYKDFGGLKVPTLIIKNRGGEPALIVVVKDAKAG